MRLGAFGALLVLLGAPAAFAQDPARIATIKTLKGTVQVIGDSAAGAARIGDALHQNDTIETGADGALGLTFVDNTTMSMGPRSRITLTKIVFNPDQGDYAFATKIVRGTFMFATGTIAKLAPKSVEITTPLSTLGIRGTRFLVRVEE